MIPSVSRRRPALAVAAAIALAAHVPRSAAGDPAEDERAARALYSEGARHFNLAEYDRAIDLFERAYHLFPSPEFLFNVAQAHRLKGAGHCRKALQAYRAYLELVPATPDRSLIEGWIPGLETCARHEAEHAAAARRLPPPPPAPGGDEGSGRAHVIAGWSLVAGGALLAGGGGLMLRSVAGEVDDLEASCGNRCDPAEVDPVARRETIGLALVAGGAAALVTGAVLLLVRARRSAAPARAALSAAGPGLLVTIRFD